MSAEEFGLDPKGCRSHRRIGSGGVAIGFVFLNSQSGRVWRVDWRGRDDGQGDLRRACCSLCAGGDCGAESMADEQAEMDEQWGGPGQRCHSNSALGLAAVSLDLSVSHQLPLSRRCHFCWQATLESVCVLWLFLTTGSMC